MSDDNDAASNVVRLTSERVGADLLRTADRDLRLQLDETDDFRMVHIMLDGLRRGGMALWLGDDVESSIAVLADRLQEHTLDEEIWGGWPTCPIHHTHPLTAVAVDGRAVWRCGAINAVVAAIGELDTIG